MSEHTGTHGSSTPVGFIGLGNIGAPIATRLLAWPGGLVVCDARAEVLQPFLDRGATSAATPAQVAESASVICVMVNTDAQVRDVIVGPEGILRTARPGTTIVVHSTVDAETPEQLAAIAAASQVDVVDAPVSGGAMGAHDGTLAVMVGGPDAAVERCTPVLELIGTLVEHMGPVGSGTRTKLARNLITFASFAVVGEATRLAAAAGLDPMQLGRVVRHSDRITSGPGAIMLRDSAEPLPDDDGLRPIFGHTAELGSKDLELAVELGERLGVDMSFGRRAAADLRAALGLEPFHPTDR